MGGEKPEPQIIELLTVYSEEHGPCWAYLSIPLQRIEEYKQDPQAAFSSGCGDVLVWGLGSEVPAEIARKITLRFGHSIPEVAKELR
ncbi:MAG: hypothetical protein KDD64_10130 [Bdellovibrionales bacterium]|nr:hypothetical protein [Bdellovibrionales bacterium]